MPVSFQLDSLSEFVRIESRESPDQIDERIPNWLLAYCCLNGELELVPPQRAAIASLRKQQLELYESQTQAWNASIQANNTQELTDEIKNQRRKQITDYREKIVPTIENILLPHQHDVLTEFAARTKFTLHGPVAAILGAESAATAKTENSVDDDQSDSKQNKTPIWSRIENEELKFLAEQEQNKINKLLIQIEQDSNRTLRDELLPAQRKKYDQMVGKPLYLERGNIELHLAIARRSEEVSPSNQEPIWMEDIQVDPEAVKNIADGLVK